MHTRLFPWRRWFDHHEICRANVARHKICDSPYGESLSPKRVVARLSGRPKRKGDMRSAANHGGAHVVSGGGSAGDVFSSSGILSPRMSPDVLRESKTVRRASDCFRLRHLICYALLVLSHAALNSARMVSATDLLSSITTTGRPMNVIIETKSP